MRPDPRFSGAGRSFWAHVKLISESVGYSGRGRRGAALAPLRRYTAGDLAAGLAGASLEPTHLYDAARRSPTALGQQLLDYLNFRATLLESQVAPNLMDRDQAAAEFQRLREELRPTCALPLNKQKGEKRHYAYLTGIVNMLTEKTLGGRSFDDEPRGLTIITREHAPLRTLSRWMDGAYPTLVDPRAIWEVKEYYGTTTFGSRVADGVYETMLDGEELAELERSEGRKVLHYLILDDRFTWWQCGRSYLCRIVDMLHMGLVDEVVVGRGVLTRWPQIVQGWVDSA